MATGAGSSEAKRGLATREPFFRGSGVALVTPFDQAGVHEDTMRRLVRFHLDGDTATATDLQLRYLPLIRALFAVPNPIPVKTLTGWLGFNVGPVRLPLVPLTDDQGSRLTRVARNAGLEPAPDMALDLVVCGASGRMGQALGRLITEAR